MNSHCIGTAFCLRGTGRFVTAGIRYCSSISQGELPPEPACTRLACLLCLIQVHWVCHHNIFSPSRQIWLIITRSKVRIIRHISERSWKIPLASLFTDALLQFSLVVKTWRVICLYKSLWHLCAFTFRDDVWGVPVIL